MSDGLMGTYTFLLTDIERSTELWEQEEPWMRAALQRHDNALRCAITENGGTVVKPTGDGFHGVFVTAGQALDAAIAAQCALHRLPPTSLPSGGALLLRVRMGLHSGPAEARDNDYYGPTMNRVARIMAAGHGGQILLSNAVYSLLQHRLRHTHPGARLQDMGEHRLPSLKDAERIWQVVHTELPQDFPPLRSLDNLPNNLPYRNTSFIGRETEIANIREMLSQSRLVVLTGSGGCGKSRLALQVAAELLDAYPGGAWLVELAPLSDPTLVPQAVAQALRIREVVGQETLQTLLDDLRHRRMLLILDNCEHLIAACAGLTDALVRQCPHVKLLVTSQTHLNIGESLYRVPSLQLPEDGEQAAPEALLRSEAARLFVARAQSARHGFRADAGSAADIDLICRRLDGIPLAIELAAARTRVLSARQIAQRLDDMFGLLTDGYRTSLPRHRTLRALMDWSYDLLEEEEAPRLLLRRLCVFAGGWTLEAAEAICAGDGIAQARVLDLLSDLVGKSLAVFEEQQLRYRLLEIARQYGREKVEESGETAALRARHRDYYLTLAEETEPKLAGPEQERLFDRLESEHDNLRAAIAFCAEENNEEAELRLIGALGRFWEMRGYLLEGRERLESALARGTGRSAHRARALKKAGWIACARQRYGLADSYYREALSIYQEQGNPTEIAAMLNLIGLNSRMQGNLTEARPV